MHTSIAPSTTDLFEAYAALRKTRPELRQREAAAHLGVSEGALVAAHAGRGAFRIANDWQALFRFLETVGPVMALTRNEHCVIEKSGPYAPFEMAGPNGLVLGEDIDLRLFFARWSTVFAFEAPTRRGPRWSLQAFDASGLALHKVFLKEAAQGEALLAWAREHSHEDQRPSLDAAPARTVDRPDAAIDREALLTDWRALEDTHDFFPMLRKHDVGRLQALRLAEPRLAQRISQHAYRDVLQRAAASQLPIMVFVGSPGCIEIHTGPVHHVKTLGAWLNVLDPGFNLHLNEPGVAETWIVRKPTRDGVVTSVELFDASGETIALLFGKRKPGTPEDEGWRDLVAALA